MDIKQTVEHYSGRYSSYDGMRWGWAYFAVKDNAKAFIRLELKKRGMKYDFVTVPMNLIEFYYVKFQVREMKDIEW